MMRIGVVKRYDENKNKLIFKKTELPDGADCTACEHCVTGMSNPYRY